MTVHSGVHTGAAASAALAKRDERPAAKLLIEYAKGSLRACAWTLAAADVCPAAHVLLLAIEWLRTSHGDALTACAVLQAW